MAIITQPGAGPSQMGRHYAGGLCHVASAAAAAAAGVLLPRGWAGWLLLLLPCCQLLLPLPHRAAVVPSHHGRYV
jgi:hypothetical protein